MKGRLYATVELARRLEARGHEVVVAGPKSNETVVTAAGLRSVTIPDYPLGGPNISRPKGNDARTPLARRARLRAGVEALGVGGLPEMLSSVQPDLVLIDFEMHAYIMTTVARGYRVALFTGICTGLPGLRAPPNHWAVVPGQGLGGSRLGVAAAWACYWLVKARRRLKKRLRSGGADYQSILRAHARAVGFDMARRTTFWRWQIPFSYPDLPLLLLHARAFDLPTPVSARIRYIGPVICRSRRAASPPRGEIDQALRELETRRNDPRCRIVYLAFGTLKSPQPHFLEQIWDVVRRNPDWHFVFAAGTTPQSALPDPAPTNLRILAWAPQPDFLRLSHAAVIHAGANSIVESVTAGVPMLCYPFPVNDQLGNGARVVYHGIGTVGALTETSQAIERDLKRIMDDPAIHENLARMRRAFLRYEEEQTAERTIEELLAS
ncbi:MAG: glycosyltransferase [Kiloniellales bacterium]|nr:glycosyltransferase [Kiloniellales bacterium]